MQIRKILKEKMKDALELVWKVFLEYEAPDYSEEGIKEFKKTIDDSDWIETRDFYGAFDDTNKILGVIDIDTEQCVNGLRFYPMRKKFKRV